MSTLQTTILKHPDSASNNIQFDSSGNTAIGHGTPGLKLHVQDGALASAPTPNGNCDVVIEGTDNTGIQFLSSVQTQLRFGDAASTAAGAILYTHSDDNFKLNYSSGGKLSFNNGSGERAQFDGDGRLLIGQSSARTGFFNVNAITPALQVETTAQVDDGRMISLVSNAGASSGYAPTFLFGKTRSTTAGGVTGVANDDELGAISFQGADGAQLVEAARIAAVVDGTTGTDDIPGSLTFSTTPDGADAPELRLTIDSSGNLTFPNSAGTIIQAVQPGVQYRNLTLRGDEVFIGTGTGSAALALKIDTSHNALVGTETNGSTAKGIVLRNSGELLASRNSGPPLLVNRLGTDGTLIDFRGQNTTEGSLLVSGTLVSLSGAHISRWSQLPGGIERIEILRGSVLSNLDEMCEWAYEATDAVLYTEDDELPEGVSVGDVKEPARPAGSEDNEQLNRMKVSDIEGDKNVAGVFMCWDDDDDTYTNDFYCAMTGDHVIRISQGVTVARGDLLMSAGDGTAKPQDDDIVRSKTVAKVTSTTVSETYEDGSYCVPCVLMAC